MFSLAPFTLACCLSLSAPALAVGPDETPAQYQKLVAERANAIVTVKFVLKIDTGGVGQDAEQETEVYGVMIDPKGLILLSNSELDGFAGMMRRFRGGAVTTTPKDIKVLIGDDSEGVPAKVLAHDTELDLAWVQIEKPGEKPFVFVDLEKAATVSLGERMLSLEKLGKYFDRAVVVQDVRVGAVAHKPRPFYLFTGSSMVGRGVPFFTTAGEFVGITTLLFPSAEELEGGAARTSMGGALGQVPKVLPAAELITATRRAREAAAGDGEKAPEKPADKSPDKAPSK